MSVNRFLMFLAGLLSGAVIGGAVALLFAPSSGQELQERIRIQVNDLVEEGKRAAERQRAELEAQLEAFKHGRTAA